MVLYFFQNSSVPAANGEEATYLYYVVENAGGSKLVLRGVYMGKRIK